MTENDEIQELISYQGPDRIVHFTEYMEAKKKTQRQHVFTSGFDQFDKYLGKLETGRVVVVSGYAKNGKTLFAESWIESILKRDPILKAGIFSFEIQPEKLLEKHSSNPGRSLYLPFELKTMDFAWLKKRCLEAKLKYDCKIILLDHLHFLVDMMTQQNMSLNIGAFMRKLKFEIAMELDLAVILITHQAKGKDGAEASAHGARDSSFISQECDAFVVVTRRKNFNQEDFNHLKRKRPDTGPLIERELSDIEVNAGLEHEYSQGLAVVKVDVSRMSGEFGAKTTFRKVGEFLEEL